MKKYKFVKFNGFYPRGDIKISLNKSGLIRLSSGFCRVTKATNFQYAILFYDKTNNAIAFKFTQDLEDGRMKITKDTTGATISGLTFCKANNINPNLYFGRYDWDKLILPEVGEVYIIELSKK